MNNMKYMIKKITFLLAFCLISNFAFSQDIQKLEVEQDTVVKDSLILSEPLLVDEVLAVVGTRMILLSDFMSKQIMWKQERGLDINAKLSEQEKLDVMEQLLAQKLLAVNAIADSLEVNEASIFGKTEARISELTMQLGSVKAIEEMFNADIHQIREKISYQLFEEDLAGAMKRKIVENLSITPHEVTKFARTIPEESIEIIPRQITYSHIVKQPTDDYQAKLSVKADLLELRKRIMGGDSFSGLARLYSDDKSTAVRGGEMDYVYLNGLLSQNFENAVKTMTVGSISGIIETEYGFHIIELMDIKNNMYKVRHILMRLEMNDEELQASLLKLDSIAVEIRNDKITFSQAAINFSDDEKSRDSHGVVLNIESAARMGVQGQTAKFSLDALKYDSKALADLKVGEISDAFISYHPATLDKVCKIVMITGDYPEHRASLIEDNHIFESLAFNAKRNEAFDIWVNKKIKTSYVKISEPYNKSKFKFNWVASQNEKK